MRANLTIYLGLVVFIVGAASGIELNSWRWLLYGALGTFLIWGTLVIAPPAPTTCQFCGREEG